MNTGTPAQQKTWIQWIVDAILAARAGADAAKGVGQTVTSQAQVVTPWSQVVGDPNTFWSRMAVLLIGIAIIYVGLLILIQPAATTIVEKTGQAATTAAVAAA